MNPSTHRKRRLPTTSFSRRVLPAVAASALLVSAMATAGSAAAPADVANRVSITDADSLISTMRSQADGGTRIVIEPTTRAASLVRAQGESADLFPHMPADSPGSAAAKTDAYLSEFAGVFGARPEELVRTEVRRNLANGWTINYQQSYRGVSVFGAQLKANVSENGDLTAVSGMAVPHIDLDAAPTLESRRASRIAVTAVASDPPPGVREGADGLRGRAELVVYRKGLVRGVRGANVLAWHVEVTGDARVKESLIVDARTGKLLNRYSMIHDSLDRNLYEETYGPTTRVWSEGDPFPGVLTSWQQNEVTATGESYWLFKNAFDRDSYDGNGHVMETINNDPRISCPNANWNGSTTNYCDGTATDDVIAHEWGHAYTQFTGGLIYQWQSGALNESYSDIWGETLDLINDRDDSDQDVSPRSDGDCSTHGRRESRPIQDTTCMGDATVGSRGARGVIKPQREGRNAPASESYRWLIGEDATAFGGAIRDAWTPTCMGAPGKVTDAQYWCNPGDAGGVHTNSGISNHAYALAVDGGTFNGVTVEGIGLDKAASIWWLAQDGYQSPFTDFSMHADNLDAACADLVGRPVNRLSTEPNGTPGTVTIESSDCSAVAAAADAVELRTDPQQCNFRPILDPNTPELCGGGLDTRIVWREDFEHGLGEWSTDQEVINPGATGFPWEIATETPGAHESATAYGATPDGGSCNRDADDYTSSDSIISTPIRLPSSLPNPKLSFEHYIASEDGYDGGNVKISVNGGYFRVVPNSAYTFNPGTLIGGIETQNTNPLRGEEGFTGTNGGTARGSWGTSIVDLKQIGLKPGDRIRIRLDIGRDGCSGNDGWYVDNLTITTCGSEAPAPLSTRIRAQHRPDPSTFGQASKVTVTVRAGDKRPSGPVVLRNAKNKTIAKGKVTNGNGIIKIGGRTLKVGKHRANVVYLGTAKYAKSKVRLVIRVRNR